MPDLTQFRTRVDLFDNVPLEFGSQHTILFDTKTQQDSYFNSKIKQSGTFTNISYQRHRAGKMRLQASISLLGTTNYLRFVNPTFDNKEFYAFILDIEYINNSTIEITYAIDPLQTWMFDYTVNPCYIDREHAETDNVGDNRVNEGLDTGAYVQAGLEEINPWGTTTSDTSFYVIATQGPNGEQGVTYDFNVYAAFYCVNCQSITDLNTLLTSYMNGVTGSLEPILSISQYPSSFYNSNASGSPKTAPVTYQLLHDQTIGFGPFVLTDPVGYTIPIGTPYYLDPEFTQYVINSTEVYYGKMFETGVVVFNSPDTWYVPSGAKYYSDSALTQLVGTVSNYELAGTYENGVVYFTKTVGIEVTSYYVSSADCWIAKFFCDIEDCDAGGMSLYTPKNNKLYCYPYNYMVFESPDGSSTTLRFEDFKDHNVHEFMEEMALFPYAESMCAPMDYETVTNQYNLQNALFSKGYPTVGLATDAYSAWWAQNKYSMSLIKAAIDTADAVGTAAQDVMASQPKAELPENANLFDKILGGIQSGANALTGAIGGVIGGAKAGINNFTDAVKDTGLLASGVQGFTLARAPETIASKMLAMYAHEAVPSSIVTKANAPSLLTSLGMLNYRIYYIKIRPEYAQMIDNYFSCYGYAVKQVKRPNIKSRTEWNYIKTTGCTISGNVPGDVESTICALYDAGITFWHNPNHMYRYDLDNPINREVTGNG